MTFGMDNRRLDLRQHRAENIVANIMDAIGPFISDSELEPVAHAIREVLIRDGAEIITDRHRHELGLPPRDGRGWTPAELHAMEFWRLQAIMAPIHHVIPTPTET